MSAASSFEQNLDILTKAAELTKHLRKSEQDAVIGLLKLDPKSIEDETTRLEILGVQQNLTEKMITGEIDKSMLKTVEAIHNQYASKQGGRRKRRKSRKTKRKRRKSRRRRKKRTKKRRRKTRRRR
jgi:hypothetical protein